MLRTRTFAEEVQKPEIKTMKTVHPMFRTRAFTKKKTFKQMGMQCCITLIRSANWCRNITPFKFLLLRGGCAKVQMEIKTKRESPANQLGKPTTEKHSKEILRGFFLHVKNTSKTEGISFPTLSFLPWKRMRGSAITNAAAVIGLSRRRTSGPSLGECVPRGCLVRPLMR